MNFSKVVITILCLLFVQVVVSQTISKSVIGTCGAISQSGDNAKMSWTVGETVVGTMTGGQHQLGNGFIASLDYSVLITPEELAANTIEIYPNPASEFFTCKNSNQHSVLMCVKDITGKTIKKIRVSSGDKIYTESWEQGLYLLTATDEITGLSNSYKVIIKRR